MSGETNKRVLDPIGWVSDGFISMAAAQAVAQTNAEAEAATAPGPSPGDGLGESRMEMAKKYFKKCFDLVDRDKKGYVEKAALGAGFLRLAKTVNEMSELPFSEQNVTGKWHDMCKLLDPNHNGKLVCDETWDLFVKAAGGEDKVELALWWLQMQINADSLDELLRRLSK